MMKRNDRIEPASADIEALLADERILVAEDSELRRRALVRARFVIGTPVREGGGLWPWRLRTVLGTAAVVLLTAMSATAFVLLKKNNQFSGRPSSEGAQGLDSPARTLPPARPVIADLATDTTSDVPIQSTRLTKTRESKAPPRTEHMRSAELAEDYARELKVLQPAREAIAHGDFAAALLAVARHERAFPNGRLTEEREALRIRSLIALRRSDEAHHFALAFHRHYPQSILLVPMQDALERNP